jgi:predicted esterase
MPVYLKRLRRVFASLLILLVLIALVFVIYFQATRYPALPETSACWIDNPQATITRDRVAFLPADPDNSAGVIIYPGGNVDFLAYAPLAGRISAGRYPVFVQKMPLDLAVFGVNLGLSIIQEYPEIERWVIVGHSLGGAMAARFALQNTDRVQGLVLLAAYSDVDLTQSSLLVLTISGDRDDILNQQRYTDAFVYLPADTITLTIPGGNHAGFAHYGPQRGDGAAYLTREQQQNITAEAIRSFLAELTGKSVLQPDSQ